MRKCFNPSRILFSSLKRFGVIFSLVFFFIQFISIAFSQSSWTLTTLMHFRHGTAVHIQSDSVFWACGGYITNDSIQEIQKTDDGGQFWYTQDGHFGMQLTDMEFSPVQYAVSVGRKGTVKRSTDLGNTWTDVPLSGQMATQHLNGFVYISPGTGIAVGGIQTPDSTQCIIRTTDDGASWTQVLYQQGAWLKDVGIAGNGPIIAVGDSNVILRSTDAGLTWNPVTCPLTSNRVLNAVWFTFPNEGFIVGGRNAPDSMMTILHTTDAGLTWTVLKDSLAPMLNDVHFYSPLNGYAVGDSGAVYSTDDGGMNWNSITIPGGVNDSWPLNAVRFVSPNLGLLVGQWGKCIVYRNNIISRESEYENLYDLNVFPNPVSENLTLKLSLQKPESGHVQIIHSGGSMMQELEFDGIMEGENQIELSLKGFAEGLYLLRIFLGDEIISQKVIVQR